MLLSACEKNQAQCKISAMTFISKRKKNKLFYHFHPVKTFYLYKMVVENRVPYVHTEFGEGVTVQLNKTKF